MLAALIAEHKLFAGSSDQSNDHQSNGYAGGTAASIDAHRTAAKALVRWKTAVAISALN